MSIKTTLAAAAAAIGLGACSNEPKLIESCSSNLATASVHDHHRDLTLSVNLSDSSTGRRYYREGFVTQEDLESTKEELSALANDFCRTKEFPDDDGVPYEADKVISYQCEGTSDNIAKVLYEGSEVVLYTGNHRLAAKDGSETTEEFSGYTSKDKNVYGLDEAKALAREHCRAPSIDP